MINHVFALVWNASMGCWTVTHEYSKRCRKGGRRRGKPTLPALLLGAASGLMVMLGSPAGAATLYWDGDMGMPNDSIVNGGAGIWDSSGSNWTTADGQINDYWRGDVAVFQGMPGIVTVDHTQGFTGLQFLVDGYRLQSGPAAQLAAFNGSGGTTEVSVADGATASIDVNIIGGGLINKLDTGTLVLSGANTYTGGTRLDGGTLSLGDNSAIGSGSLLTANGTTLDTITAVTLANPVNVSGNLTVGGSSALTLNGPVYGAGGLIKNGNADLVLNGRNLYSGNTVLNAGKLILGSGWALGYGALNAADGTTLDTNTAVILSNPVNLAGTLYIGGSADLTLSSLISGSGGLVKNGASTLTLSWTNAYAGATTVNAGTLNLTGRLSSSRVSINNGATLKGSGTIFGTLIIDSGGHLALSSGATLHAGSLLLNANSVLDTSLSRPSSTPLMIVDNSLVLDGTLNVSGLGGFGNGVYRLFDYSGTLVDNGLNVNSAPSGFGIGNLAVQTSIGNQVNLVVSAPTSNISFWDGSQVVPNGVVDGGNGTWSVNGNNWTDLDGIVNQTWAGDFGVFQGTAGTVQVDGQHVFTGLQFSADGYSLVKGTAGQLTAVNGSSGTTAVRVDPGVTATIGVDINGSGTLAKLDSGTLVLNGANSYTGGTRLDGGALTVGSNTALGTGVLTAASGTQLDSNTSVTLGNPVTLNGNLSVLGSNNLSLNGSISGPGGLIKNGSATLTLGGNNTFLGPVALNAGGLILGADTALGTSSLNVADGTTLDASTVVFVSNGLTLAGNLDIAGSKSLFLAGHITGTGGLTKDGGANLAILASNTYSGNTRLNAGTLTLGNNSALGRGSLVVDGGSTLDTVTDLTVGNAVVLNAELLCASNDSLTLGGVISGAGRLYKYGMGNLTLNGANNYQGGTSLTAGTLTLGSSGALGTGLLAVAGNSTLKTNNPLVLANDINLLYDTDLTVSNSSNLTLAGSLMGIGTLIKTGTGNLTLEGSNTFSGALDVQAGSVSVVGNSALANNAKVNLQSITGLYLNGSAYLGSLSGSGDVWTTVGNTLGIGGSDLDTTFNGQIYGNGDLLKLGLGTLTLGSGNSLTGNTTVDSGTLKVNGTLNSANVQVNLGSTLTGNGTLTGNVTVANRGHLALSSGNTLTMGSLTLNNASRLDVDLGAPITGGGPALLATTGNLTLDGTLNISDLGGFGSGVYRLANYSGNLTDNGLLIGSVPGSVVPSELEVQTVLANQVNLLVSAPGVIVQIWDGSQPIANGAIDGGSGTWASGTSNWTNVDGTVNRNWADSFAVFQGSAGTVTVDGAQTLSGLQFASDGYTLNAGSGGVLNAVNGAEGYTAVRVDPNASATLNVAIQGNATLAKLDSGTLVLNGANTYTGGTLLKGGKLVLGNSGALGSGSLTASGSASLDSSAALTLNNAVTLDGELGLAGSHDLTLAGVISGNGSLTKQGSSSLTLSGDNTFSGALNILGGSLALTGTNALGNTTLNIGDTAAVRVGGALTLEALNGSGDLLLGTGSELRVGSNDADSTFGGNLSGGGSLSKTGSGKLVLNGQSAIGGGTHVEAGSLVVGGAAGSSAQLASDVQVDSGAMIGGHGTILGDVNLLSGATLNPGNSIGTLHVDGDVNLAAGSTLEIEASPDGSSDKLISTGTVNLGGARLSVLAGAGNWLPSTQYGIVQAAALDGTFSEITSNLAFLTPEVTYSATGVELTLARNEVSFVSVGRTSNQRATAAAVDTLGSGSLYDAVSTLSAKQAQAAYDNLSGELHASTQGALFDDSHYVRDAIGQRLRAAQGRAPAEGVLHSDADSGITFWLQGYGGWGSSDGNSNAAGLDHDSRGTLFGIDLPVGDNWRVGVAAGYGTSDLDVDARSSTAEIDSTSLTFYAAGQWDAINLRLGASHGWNDIDSSRHVRVDGLAEHDKASYDARTTQVFGELGYAVSAADFILEPFAGLARVKVDSDSFKEHGGSTALRGDDEQDSLTYGTLGLHASTALTTLGSVPLALQGTLGWQHAFDDLDPDRRMSFAGSSDFTVRGTPVAQDTALAQLSMTAQVAADTTVDLGYSGQFGDGYRDSGVRLGLNMSF